MVENRNVAVGLFMTVAILLFVGFTVWITGKKGDEETTAYSILFERDVSGLMLGGPVFFLGVNIGQVQNMVIEDGNIQPHIGTRLHRFKRRCSAIQQE